MTRLPLLALLAVAFAPSAALAAPPSSLVEQVRASIVAAVTEGMTPEEIADPEMSPASMLAAPDRMFSRVDVNGDTLPDWMVDFGEAPAATYFCGTGGCHTELYLGAADGSVTKVFDTMVREIRLSGPKSGRIVDVDFHGSVCGGFGVDECPRRYGWDQASQRFLERPNKKGQTLMRYGPTPVMDRPLSTAPAEVQAEVARRSQICAAAGGRFDLDDSNFVDVPDLNGDGLRDWVVGTWDSCSFEGDGPETPPLLPLTVLVTRGASLVTALDREQISWELDIASQPAQFNVVLDNVECGLEANTCVREPQVWNPATSRLETRP
jgi:hypothetical protein